MHGLYPLVISTGEFARRENIFGIIVAYFKQPLILPFFCLFRIDFLCDLNINFLILLRRHKIDLSIAGLSPIDGISPPSEFHIHNIFKARSHAVCIITEDTVPQGDIGKVEFFLCFQDFFSLQIVPRTAVEQICLFQLVNSFVIKCTAFRLQVVRNRLCRSSSAIRISLKTVDQLHYLPHILLPKHNLFPVIDHKAGDAHHLIPVF